MVDFAFSKNKAVIMHLDSTWKGLPDWRVSLTFLQSRECSNIRHTIVEYNILQLKMVDVSHVTLTPLLLCNISLVMVIPKMYILIWYSVVWELVSMVLSTRWVMDCICTNACYTIHVVFDWMKWYKLKMHTKGMQ